jgi:hypothetical protein
VDINQNAVFNSLCREKGVFPERAHIYLKFHNNSGNNKQYFPLQTEVKITFDDVRDLPG